MSDLGHYDILDDIQSALLQGGLRSQVDSMKKSGAPLQAPLPEYKKSQIERTMNYEGTQLHMTKKWVPQMSHQKHKEAIDYGYTEASLLKQSTKLLSEKFEPTSNLEAELLELSHPETGDGSIPLDSSLPMSEGIKNFQNRNAARLKALLKREQDRAKRLGKIKSKVWHRIKNRAENRQKESLMERLQVENPELHQKLMEDLEKKNAILRTQRKSHSQSKWRALAQRFGGKEMQKEIGQQAQRYQNEKESLMRMVKGGEKGERADDSSSEEEDEDGEDVIEMTKKRLMKEMEEMDKEGGEEKGIRSLPFMRRAAEAARANAREMAEECLRELEGEEGEEGEEKSAGLIQEIPVFDQTELDEAEIEAMKALGLYQEPQVKPRPVNESIPSVEKIPVTIAGAGESRAEKKKTAKKQEKEEREKRAREESEKQKREEEEDQEEEIQHPEENPWFLPAEVSVHEDTQEDALDLQEAKILLTNDLDNAEQRKIIHESFQVGDIEREWQEQADALEEEENEKKSGKTPKNLPGWGSGWAGAKGGDKRRRGEASSDTPDASQAKKNKSSQGVGLFQVSNKRDKKAAAYQIDRLPHGVTAEGYQQTLNTPLGPEWNTKEGHQRLIKKQINVRIGSVVAPLQHAKYLPALQQDSLLQQWDSRKKKNYTKSRM